VCRIGVPYPFSDHVDLFIGMPETSSCLRHAAGRHPGDGTSAGGALQRSGDVRRRPVDGVGDVIECETFETVTLDEAQRLGRQI
jgi:hypothetical protein